MSKENEGVSTNIMNVDTNGKLNEWLPATPIGMCCEKGDCKNTNGRDYKRRGEYSEEGWEDEPIFLCDEHAAGYRPFVGGK